VRNPPHQGKTAMDMINIRDAAGKLRKNIAVLRAPEVGEFVRVGTEWQQVEAVWHSWLGTLPIVTIGMMKAPAHAAALQEADLIAPD
jgi:hypothetical protein